jgi:UDP-N-acetylmuramyl tripeptide synthase
MLATRIDPTIVSTLAADLGPVIIVVGTNGKTTTARLTARVLGTVLGLPPLANRSGANLVQGLSSAVVAEARLNGRIRHPGRAAVFEVDELALERVVGLIAPRVLVILNLFRDQLDRFGEVETVIDRWRLVLGRVPPSTIVVSCADDPRVDHLVRESGLRAIRFGLDSPADRAAASTDPARRPSVAAPSSADPVGCPTCGRPLAFAWRSIGHLGDWACPEGHVRRDPPDLVVGTAGQPEPGSSRLVFDGAFGRHEATIHLSGAAAAYDAAAAVAAAIAVGIGPGAAIAALDGATPAFGRLEEAQVEGRRVVLALSKNPASLTESAGVAAAIGPDSVLIGLSDEPADGRDVSWIWDVDFDWLGRIPAIGLTGTRADDLAIRLDYAVEAAADRWPIAVSEPGAEDAFEAMLARTPAGGTLVVLATYTSLLAIRRTLERRQAVPAMPR